MMARHCPYNWGMHSCYLIEDHDGDHECWCDQPAVTKPVT